MIKPPVPLISPVTTTRRTVLEWLGKGAVLALGSDLLAACSTMATDPPPGLEAPDASLPAPTGFTFGPGPGEGGVFVGWGQRTVDTQEVSAILANWSLRVDGLVERPMTLSFADLCALTRQDQVTDFHCVEGWSIDDVPWSGVLLDDLLARVGVTAAATHVLFHTVGEIYNDSLPLAVAREPRSLLGYGIAGSTLPLAHGFPVRVVVPRLLGYKNAKFVARVEVVDHQVDGYWVQRGYPYAGEVPPHRLREGKY